MENWLVSWIALVIFTMFIVAVTTHAIDRFISSSRRKDFSRELIAKYRKTTNSIHDRTCESKPIYIQRGSKDSVYDFDTLEQWEDLGILSATKGRINKEELKDISRADS